MGLESIKDFFNKKVSNVDVRDKSALELFQASVALKRERNKSAANYFISFIDKAEEELQGKDKENYAQLEDMSEIIKKTMDRLDPNSPTYESMKKALDTRMQMIERQRALIDKKNQLYDAYIARGVKDMSQEEIYNMIPDGGKKK